MQAARKRTLVVAALVREGGKVLMSRRRADQPMPLLWEFPGGKVEPGEHPHAALVRELREELGCELEVGRIHEVVFHAYADFDLYMLVYDGRITAKEHKAIAWVKPNDMDAYPMPPADPPLVAWLRDLL